MTNKKAIEVITHFDKHIIPCDEYGYRIDSDLMEAHLMAAKALRNGWIPVSERLPDKQHDWVLVACKLHPEGFYGVPHIGELRNGVWWDDCYEVPLKDAGVEVTHWMPLPEPPKEEMNNG